MYEFRLPDVGEGLSEGELVEWLVKVGDEVREGDDIANVSTDKVVVTLNAPCTGRIAELAVPVGTVVPVGGLLLRIETGSHGSVAAPPASTTVQPGGTHGSPTAGGVPPRRPIRAAPPVRKFAQERGVDLEQLAAALGKDEVSRADVEAWAAGERGAPAADERRERLTGPRLAAAQRLAESARTLATTTMSMEVHADAVINAVTTAAAAGGARLTPLAVIAHAVVATLRQHRRFNARIDEEHRELVMPSAVHLGVAMDTPGGLVVPVLRDADRLDVPALADAITVLADRARRGALGAAELQGSTFTLSSTGGLERATIRSTTPIVNLPNVATLWVSRIRDRPRVNAGALEVGPVLACSLSFDHRYLHGADAIAFLNDLSAQLAPSAVS